MGVKDQFQMSVLASHQFETLLVFAAAYLNLVDLSPDHKRPVVLLFPLHISTGAMKTGFL